MPELASTSSRAQSVLAGVLERRGRRAHKLGLTLSTWDPAGELAAGPDLHREFCEHLCGDARAGLSAMGELAQRACLDGAQRIGAAPTGCSLLAVPLRLRRRLVGAAVGCFPALQTADSEELARACSQGGLDRELLAGLCRDAACHDAGRAADLCDVLEWLVQDELDQHVACEELGNLSSNLANTYEELSLLYRISGSMKVTQDTTEFFQGVCKEVLEVMQLEAAAVALCGRDDGESVSEVVFEGDGPLSAAQVGRIVSDVLGEPFRGAARPVLENHFAARAAALGEDFSHVRTLIAVPLMCAETYRGALVGINKIGQEFDTVDLKLMSSIGSQAAVFLENHLLYDDLQDLLMGVLHALTASIDAKDPYTCGHSRRVALISRELAQMYGLGAERAERVYLAGLLHDIGKIGIPEAVLCKTGKLTELERRHVMRHPGVGANILGGLRQLEDVVPAILHHHERLDGRGYPDGLSGQQIPIEALILGLADSFDAMTSSRTYRPAMPMREVLCEIRRGAGTQFDPRAVQLLLSLDLEGFLSDLRETAGSDGGTLAGN